MSVGYHFIGNYTSLIRYLTHNIPSLTLTYLTQTPVEATVREKRQALAVESIAKNTKPRENKLSTISQHMLQKGNSTSFAALFKKNKIRQTL